MLLVSLAVSAYAREKTTRILDKDDELSAFELDASDADDDSEQPANTAAIARTDTISARVFLILFIFLSPIVLIFIF